MNRIADLVVSRADIGDICFYSVPLNTKFRGVTVREGVLLRGPAGWGEFCAFADYSDLESVAWLRTALEAAFRGWPDPVRHSISVSSIVPAVDPDDAHRRVLDDGCRTAKVKVADHPDSLPEDVARVEAVRDALGSDGAVRIDANGKWGVDAAIERIPILDVAAGGLEYVEQPCASVAELARVRRRVDVPIAADESIRRADDPLNLLITEAADIAVLKCSPLGGVYRSLEVAAAANLPVVVSSALETSIGLAAELALAAALPDLDYACGLGTHALLVGDLSADTALVPVDGMIAVSGRRLAPAPHLLRQWEMADGQRVDWWSKRVDRVLAIHNEALDSRD